MHKKHENYLQINDSEKGIIEKKANDKKQRQQLLKVINKYYPQGIDTNNPFYWDTAEYKQKMIKCNEAKRDVKKRKRLHNKLKKIFRNCHVTDFTDTDEYCSFEFLVLLHRMQPILDNDIELQEQLGGEKKELHIFFSNLAQYYYFYFLSTKYKKLEGDWIIKKTYSCPNDFKSEMEDLILFLESEQYELVTENNAKYIVHNVATNLLESGRANIFHCMFSDLFTLESDKMFE